MKHTLVIMLCVSVMASLSACKDEDGAEKTTPTKEPAKAAASAPAGAGASGEAKKGEVAKEATKAEASPKKDGPAAADKETLPEHMKAHFKQAVQIREAIIAGNLAGVAEPAKWLASHEKHGALPKDWQPMLVKMQAAATQIAEAKDLEAAGSGLGALGIACASCHEGTAKPAFAVVPMPSGAEDTKAHMQRHAWGVGRLWEGLVKPSDTLWNEGAIVLAEEPLNAHKFLAGQTISDKAKGQAATVHKLAGEALAAKTTAERGPIYGKLLGTCSGCHSEMRPTK